MTARLTHWVLALGRGGPTDGQGVGVHLADLPLGLALGRALGGRGSPLDRARAPAAAALRPVVVPVDARRAVHHGHALRAHQPLFGADRGRGDIQMTPCAEVVRSAQP